MSVHSKRRSTKLNRSASRRRVQVERLEDRRMLALSAELVANLNTDGTNGSNPFEFVEVGDTAYFTAATPTRGRELWKSDGTTGGTVLVADIFAGATGSNPSLLTNVNGTLFFRARDAASGYELWKTDGTAGGTTLVKDIQFGANGSYPTYLENVNGKLFFGANDGFSGQELWQSNGTSGGTFRIKDIRSGNTGSFPAGLTNVNGVVYFAANDGVAGTELWKSDGTLSGTVLVRNINGGAAGSYPNSFTNVNGTVFFSASDAASGRELWKSNGTTVTTVQVANLASGAGNSNPEQLAELKGSLYFRANDGVSGAELWKSNGTAVGTVRVFDVAGDSNDFSPFGITNIDDTLWFNAKNPSTGYELWKSDGTTAGTVEVAEIRPGPTGSYPFSFAGIGGLVFFRADDGTVGNELWSTDGTAAGTQLVLDIESGANGAFPSYLTAVGGNLFFSAADSTNGREVWKVTGLPPALEVSDNVTYTENELSPALADGGTITTSPGTNLSGSTLTVTITANGTVKDFLHLFNAGNGPGQIGLSSGVVSYGGIPIANFTGGVGTTPLVITFNGSADSAGIEATLRATRFRSRTENPTTATRTIELVFVDGDGNASNKGVVLAAVVPVNDAPKVTFSAGATYVENSAALVLAPGATVSDVDSANFGGGKLRVTIPVNANANDRLWIRSGTPAPGVISVSGTSVRLNTTEIGTIVSNGVGTNALEISLKTSATVAATQALVRALTFRTIGDTPSTAQRTIRVVVVDGDAPLSAPNNGTSNPATSTKFVAVQAVVDPPKIWFSGSVGYTRSTPAITLVPGATVTDADSNFFTNGRLRVRIAAGSSSANQLGIGAGFSIDGSNNVRHIGTNTIVGKRISSGLGTNELIVTFLSSMSKSIAQQLVRSVTFRTNGGSAGQRGVVFTISDGTGGVSAEITKIVNVT